MEEFYIGSDGIRLHAKLQKPENAHKYPLVIVIHGLTGHMEEEHIIAASDVFCELGCAALRVEMYGHGKSEGEFADHTMFKWASNLLDVVRYVKQRDDVTDIYLCGHSQGGLLAVMGGGLLPDAFQAIIPLSPAVMIPEQIREGVFFDEQIDFKALPDSFDFFGHRLNSEYMRVARMIDTDDYIDKYDKPVLVIHGDRDEDVPLAYGVSCAKRYQNGRLEIVEGADHCFTGHIEEFKKVLYRSMKKLLEEA